MASQDRASRCVQRLRNTEPTHAHRRRPRSIFSHVPQAPQHLQGHHGHDECRFQLQIQRQIQKVRTDHAYVKPELQTYFCMTIK